MNKIPCFSDKCIVIADSKGAIPLAQESDINVLTGLLKLYMRELPEALFTDILYPKFVEGMGKLANTNPLEHCP